MANMNISRSMRPSMLSKFKKSDVIAYIRTLSPPAPLASFSILATLNARITGIMPVTCRSVYSFNMKPILLETTINRSIIFHPS